METITVGVIRVCNIYIQKSGFPSVAGSAKKIYSSSAKASKRERKSRL